MRSEQAPEVTRLAWIATRPLTTPRCWRSSGFSTEHLAEMGLIAEPTADGNLTKPEIAGEHERSCPIQASLDHVGVRRLTEALPKGAREMRHAEANQIAEIRDAHRVGQMLFDECPQPANFPRCESA